MHWLLFSLSLIFLPLRIVSNYIMYIYYILVRYGLDLVGGEIRDSKSAGVLEPAVIKLKSIKFATEAAITILRIDDMIKVAPEKKDEDSYQKARARGAI